VKFPILFGEKYKIRVGSRYLSWWQYPVITGEYFVGTALLPWTFWFIPGDGSNRDGEDIYSGEEVIICTLSRLGNTTCYLSAELDGWIMVGPWKEPPIDSNFSKFRLRGSGGRDLDRRYPFYMEVGFNGEWVGSYSKPVWSYYANWKDISEVISFEVPPFGSESVTEASQEEGMETDSKGFAPAVATSGPEVLSERPPKDSD
jgi:hypothetical protein